MSDLSVADVFLWLILPYVCLTIFVLGHIWRYRFDKFGWTSRSSQMYESRILRWANPMFHFGILAVVVGHVMGLGVPQSWTDAIGISEGLYHFFAPHDRSHGRSLAERWPKTLVSYEVSAGGPVDH